MTKLVSTRIWCRRHFGRWQTRIEYQGKPLYVRTPRTAWHLAQHCADMLFLPEGLRIDELTSPAPGVRGYEITGTPKPEPIAS